MEKSHFVAISNNTTKHLRGKEAPRGRYSSQKEIDEAAYVALHAQLHPETMEPQFYFKLHKFNLFDKKTREEAIRMFGQGTVEMQEALLDDLKQKIELDNREKESYINWYKDNNLQRVNHHLKSTSILL